MDPKTAPADDIITVTSATRSEAEVRASLGADKPADEKKQDATAKPDDKPAAEAKPDAAIEQEADSQRPDPEVSEAARKLRSNRLSDKVSRLKADAALYEEHLKEAGGDVPAFEKREYKNPQEEIDHLIRRRHDLIDATSKFLKNRKRAPVPAVAAAPPPVAAVPAPAAPPVDVKKAEFAFPKFAQWQEQAGNEEKDYDDYTIAMTVAMATFNREQDAIAARQAEETKTVEAVKAEGFEAEKTFVAEHEDYVAVTSPLADYLLKAAEAGHPVAKALQQQIVREGKNAPALWYHLAKSDADVNRLMTCKSAVEFHQTLGEIRYAARTAAVVTTPPAEKPAAAAAPAAPAPAPAKPTSDAPTPLAAVPGSSSTPRSAEAVSKDGEDADDYIRRRNPDLAKSIGLMARL